MLKKTIMFVMLGFLSVLIGYYGFSKSPSYASTLEYKNHKAEYIYYLFGDKKNPYITIELNYLNLTNFPDKSTLKNANKNIKKEFFGDIPTTENIDKDLQSLIDLKVKDYKSFEVEYKNKQDEFGNFLKWTFSRVADIIFNSNDIICVSFSEYAYCGGETDNANKTFLVLDMKNGNRISLKDLFKADYEKALSKMLASALKNDPQMKYLTMDVICPSDNFYVKDSNLVFHFNPFQISELGDGQADLEIPIKELKSLLKNDSPLLRLLK